MGKGKNTSIILGEHLDEFIKRELESGRYASASEVIRSSLIKLEEERNRYELIDEALVVGEMSGEPKFFNNESFKLRMRKKYAL